MIVRFEVGLCSSCDILCLVVVGLCGGGWVVIEVELLLVDIVGGLVGVVKVVVVMLVCVFMVLI